MRKIDYSPWAIEQLLQALNKLEGDSIDPIDSIGCFQILVELAIAAGYEGIELGGVAISPVDYRIDLWINDDSITARVIVERWLAAVAQLKTAPSGWMLCVYMIDKTVIARKYDLPDWRLDASVV